MRFVGIYREKECSPGRHQSNDALLLQHLAEHLRGSGFRVDLQQLEDVVHQPNGGSVVFSMCQSRDSLGKLAHWEENGVPIINSPRAALNTHRDHLPAIMEGAGIPFPQTHVIETAEGINGARPRNGTGFWLKRGDVHASVGADVQWLPSNSGLDEAVAEFKARGISRAALQSHCPGDEIKFYGVGDGDFFYWFYSREGSGHPVDETALADLAKRAARAAGLEIFGGDVIVAPDGELTLIDLNDWPSFAPCREAATEAIANLIRRRVHVD